MVIKFHSNGKTTKPGFKATLVGKLPKQSKSLSNIFLFSYKLRTITTDCLGNEIGYGKELFSS